MLKVSRVGSWNKRWYVITLNGCQVIGYPRFDTKLAAKKAIKKII